MTRDPLVYVDDIIESVNAILSHIDGMTEQDLRNSLKTQDAIIRRFMVIGEAANNVPDNLKEKYHHIPWREMIGMRNRLVHDYADTRLKTLWETARDDFPELKRQLADLLEQEI